MLVIWVWSADICWAWAGLEVAGTGPVVVVVDVVELVLVGPGLAPAMAGVIASPPTRAAAARAARAASFSMWTRMLRG